jgi:hypothetical protein
VFQAEQFKQRSLIAFRRFRLTILNPCFALILNNISKLLLYGGVPGERVNQYNGVKEFPQKNHARPALGRQANGGNKFEKPCPVPCSHQWPPDVGA